MATVIECVLEADDLCCLVHLLDEEQDVRVVLVVCAFRNVRRLPDGSTGKIVRFFDGTLLVLLLFTARALLVVGVGGGQVGLRSSLVTVLLPLSYLLFDFFSFLSEDGPEVLSEYHRCVVTTGQHETEP